MRKLVISTLTALAFTIAGLAFAQDGPAYFIDADVVRGAQNPAGPTCVLTPVFLTSEQMVFRADVFDAETGELLTPEMAEERGVTVTAILEDGTEVEMELGLHPREEPQIYLWVGAWTIPPVYPTGMFMYEVVVEDADGNTGSWTPIGQEREGGYSSLITVERR